LYTMRFYGAYSLPAVKTAERARTGQAGNAARGWSCSLFAALGGPTGTIYGRNFDWEHSPALLLFTDPPDGHRSVSMVDLAYLVDESAARSLASLPVSDRTALLDAPYWPFDGMNEHGLVVGMAAVPHSPMPEEPGKPTVDSLMAIRLVLDGARDTLEAIRILEGVNVRWGGGPPLHYLVADASGQAALIEYVDHEMRVLHPNGPYHLATNHLRAVLEMHENGGCWRYGLLAEGLAQTGGSLDRDAAMALLRQVSQPNTQWSVVYGASHLTVDVATGRGYDAVSVFQLPNWVNLDADQAP
jgi:hypothetical protein